MKVFRNRLVLVGTLIILCLMLVAALKLLLFPTRPGCDTGSPAQAVEPPPPQQRVAE